MRYYQTRRQARLGAIGWGVIVLIVSAAACGDDETSSPDAASGGTGSAGKSGAGGAAASGAGGHTAHAGQGGGPELGGDAGMELDPTLDKQFPPTSSEQMETWLAAGHYTSWKCEPKPTKKSDGAAAIHAHGGMNRVCTNALLASSSADGQEFPKGVASVKELYDASGKRTGTAVTVKVDAQSDGGKGWYYWEGQAIAGRGIAGCAGCHSAAGSDADHPGAGDFVYFRAP